MAALGLNVTSGLEGLAGLVGLNVTSGLEGLAGLVSAVAAVAASKAWAATALEGWTRVGSRATEPLRKMEHARRCGCGGGGDRRFQRVSCAA